MKLSVITVCFLFLALASSCNKESRTLDSRDDTVEEKPVNPTEPQEIDDEAKNDSQTGICEASLQSSVVRIQLLSKPVYLAEDSSEPFVPLKVTPLPEIPVKSLAEYQKFYQIGEASIQNEWIKYRLLENGKWKLSFHHLPEHVDQIKIYWLPFLAGKKEKLNEETYMHAFETKGESTLKLPYELDFEGVPLIAIEYRGVIFDEISSSFSNEWFYHFVDLGN